MSMNVSVPAREPRGMPDVEAMRKQRAVTKRWFVFLVALIVLLSVALIVWVFFIADIKKAAVAILGPAANLTLVLAPILAAAAGVQHHRKQLEVTGGLPGTRPALAELCRTGG